MSIYTDILKRDFPGVDDNILDYVNGVLGGDIDEFTDCEDVYTAIGDILQGLCSEKKEGSIRDTCEELYKAIKSQKVETKTVMQLKCPVNIAELAAEMESSSKDIQSIWVMNRDISNKVDSKKLEKAEAKIQQKLGRRQENEKSSQTTKKLQTATASQVFNKKDTKLEIRNVNKTMDIRIENFDLAFGDKVLLQSADLSLIYGRRYGLVGRNGLGKTTLLRMISEKQLKIPNHITVLHVEQEVVGDDTKAINSVLECDVERTKLLNREKELLSIINNNKNTDQSFTQELTEIYTKLEIIEADKATAKASIILRGLGFSTELQENPTKSFSGGWRMRLALARALFSKPDLLLLDEPTNMLDIKAIIWLENYLLNWPSTLVVVSHDRNFLETVPTDIIHLHSHRLDLYKGNYEQFEKTKAEKLKSQRREYEAQIAQRAHVQEFIDRFRYNANRASSVQSKIKMLEKMPELKPIDKEVEVKFRFPEVESLNPPVLALNEVGFYYSTGNQIFDNVNLSGTSDSRICIVGENGTGKTTLLKIIIGQLTAKSGTITMHRGLRIGYFAQHHVDNLEMDSTCVDILECAFPGRTHEEYRRQLGSFGISGPLALQTVGSLSGGQKSRVAFAKVCMACPNFLILDEPTNHLDLETIDALGLAIKNFKGGVILVSHDEKLIKLICKELWVCANKTVQTIEGGIDSYKNDVLREIENLC